MNFPIVREYKTDILNTHPDNEQRGEPFKVKAGKFSRIIIPIHAPFFVSSLKMYFPNGEPMKYDVDFRIFRLMPRLTDTAAEPIACMIELMKDEIVEGTIDYDIIGHFSLFDSTLMSLIRNAVEDDRPVWWENVFNKPVVFRPKLHTHSLIYDVVAFQDFIEVLDLITLLADSQGKPILQVKIERYIDTFIYRLNLYREMLKKLIQSHASTKNEHGLTAVQVGLEKVDNFATAVGSELLENRTDLHLTVQGLQTIIDRYGFNDSEFLKADNLPISQFGNTNFIPPNISGSFEGFGGVIETGGMCLESDGSLTYLWNRMDGRTSGLYYSVLTDSGEPAKAKLTYTGFKYEHPRFVQDGASVDRIAQGSGSEVILVGDSRKGLFYIGVTNGSLDPAKHVYSKIDLTPIVAATFGTGGSAVPLNLFPFISVMLMGEWIYIIQACRGLNGDGVGSDMPIRFFFRVKLVDVQATIDVTPVRQNLSFVDAEGVQSTNVPYFRWYTTVIDQPTGRVKKGLFTFAPYLPNGYIGTYRSTVHLSAEDPARPGIYAMKLISGYYAAYAENGINGSFNFVPEVNYDFNPVTGVLTLTSKSNLPPAIDFSATPVIPEGYGINMIPLFGMTHTYAGQGNNVLEDGRIVASGAAGFSGFPRMAMLTGVTNSKTKHATVSKKWSPGFAEFSSYNSVNETIVSPLESSTDVRAMQYHPTGEFYIAGSKRAVTALGLFWKEVTGRFALRPEISNLFVQDVQSRPLTNNIKRVNSLPGIGGVTVSVPSAQLNTYGIDVGESAFCMSAQSKYYNYYHTGNGWTIPLAGDDDILLISAFDKRVEPDNSITIVPTKEIIYPAAIVAQLKAQVEFPAIATNGRACIVTVSDPTFSSLSKFGWLPILAVVTYVNAAGTLDAATQYTTHMTIEPTYVDNADGRKQVSGFTVLDKVHHTLPGTAISGISIFAGSPASASAQTTLGPMRTYYYLEGNKLTCHLNSGVMGQTIGDAYTSNFNFSYNDRATKRWTASSQQGNSSNGGGAFITPDNGIATMYPMSSVSGGAATIVNGPVSKCLVGSLYPEVGWIVFFQSAIDVTFNGRKYNIPSGSIDLRDIDANPINKTFFIYACFDNGRAYYEISQDKRLESAFQLWIGRLVTNDRQIITIDRYNVMAINGHRVSETKRGGSIPATSGLVNAEGQIPWIRQDELLP